MVEVNRFSQCLFAYLYQNYKDTPSSELSAGLPLHKDFTIPDDFPKVLGDCQIAVNKMLRIYFQQVFDKASVYACRTERTYVDFVKRRCEKLRTENASILFLIICAVVSELNLYCFQRECFRFAKFAPRCLADVLQSSDLHTILTENRPAAGPDRGVYGFSALLDYCQTISQLLQRNPDYKPPMIDAVGRKFMRMRDKPLDQKVVLEASMSALREADEDDPSEDALMATAAPLTPKNCKYCKEEGCFSYLEQFAIEFNSMK